jgi:hypothetical protein
MRWGRRRRRRGDEIAEPTEQDLKALEMMEDVLSDFSIDELREFLEADLVDVPVDPEFKKRLREQLWELVQSRARRGGPGTH